jgi:integrase
MSRHAMPLSIPLENRVKNAGFRSKILKIRCIRLSVRYSFGILHDEDLDTRSSPEAQRGKKMKVNMSWFKPSGRKTGVWKKFYKGKMYYASHIKAKGKSDKEAYRAACEWWIEKKRQLDLGTDNTVLAAFNTTHERQELRNGIVKNGTPETSLTDLIAAYIQNMEHSVKMGKIRPSTLADQRTTFTWIQDTFIAVEYPAIFDIPLTEVNQIDERVLEVYRRTIENEVLRWKADKKTGFGPHGANKRIQFFRRFLEWCYSRGSLKNLPRNLRLELKEGKLPDPDPKFFTIPEIQELFQAASQRTKLYIALSLNTGMLASDLGTLKFSMIHNDGSNLFITRKRHKTNIQCSWKLWPVTQELLVREMQSNQDPDNLVFVTERGTPIWEDKSHQGTKDLVQMAFRKARKQVFKNGDERGYKCLRKTSANLLAKQYDELPHVPKRFLGQNTEKNQRISDAYMEKQFRLVYEACDWLDSQFELMKYL